MNNPWEQLSDHPPFILPSDQQVLHTYNTNVRLEYQLRFELYPEPFIGNPDASVILLGLNPGFDPNSDRTPTGVRDINMYKNKFMPPRTGIPLLFIKSRCRWRGLYLVDWKVATFNLTLSSSSGFSSV